jgi:hypothetical protein
VRSVKTCPYDDPGGNHISPMTTYTVKFLYNDILHLGMFCVSSLPSLTLSFTFHYHYLRWTSLIIHPAMFFASWSERKHRSYDILGEIEESCSASAICILLYCRLLAKFYVWIYGHDSCSGFPSRQRGKKGTLTASPLLDLQNPFQQYREAIWLLKNHPAQKVILYVSGIAAGWAGPLLCRTIYHLPWADIKYTFFTFKRVVPSKSSEECNGPLEQKPQSCE